MGSVVGDGYGCAGGAHLEARSRACAAAYTHIGGLAAGDGYHLSIGHACLDAHLCLFSHGPAISNPGAANGSIHTSSYSTAFHASDLATRVRATHHNSESTGHETYREYGCLTKHDGG